MALRPGMRAVERNVSRQVREAQQENVIAIEFGRVGPWGIANVAAVIVYFDVSDGATLDAPHGTAACSR